MNNSHFRKSSCNSLKLKHFSVLTWTTFIFLTLTFAIPSQSLTFSSVFASSSNTNDENASNEDQEQESTVDEESSDNNDDQSSDSQSDQDNRCSDESIEGPSFIDENGCPVPCPNFEDQSDNIPEGCPVPTQSTNTDTEGSETGSTQSQLPQNNNQIQPNTLNGNLGIGEQTLDNPTLLPPIKGVQELPKDSTLFTADGYLTIKTRAVNFTPDYGKVINSISVCVQTEADNGDNTMTSYPANPHCLKGGNTSVKHTVHPGKVTLSMDVGLQLVYDESSCLVQIQPHESKVCTIEFYPNPNYALGNVKELPAFDLDLIQK